MDSNGAYHFQYSALGDYWPALLHGFLKTLYLSACSCIVCGVIVLAILLLRTLGKRRQVDILIKIYIDVVQAFPVLVGLVWVYFGLPLMGIRISSDAASIAVLGVSFSAFALDLYLGAEATIPREQVYLAILHGASPQTVAARIVFPNIFAAIADPLVGQVISLLKLSTFASVIGSQEILAVANGVITQTYRPLEVYTEVALIFLASIAPINLLRRATKVKDYRHDEIA